MTPPSALNASLARRAFLGRSAGGLGAIALASLLQPKWRASGARSDLPSFTPKAKRIIFLFMAGGPSHVDLFDPKPKLDELAFRMQASVPTLAEMKDEPDHILKLYGASDEFGYHTTENPVHIHDLHATILHQMGIPHGPEEKDRNGKWPACCR